MFDCAWSSLLHAAFSSCGEWGLLSSCRAQVSPVLTSPALQHGLQGTQASVVAARRLWSLGSVVGAHRPSCPVACGIFLDQTSNPCHHWALHFFFFLTHSFLYMLHSKIMIMAKFSEDEKKFNKNEK